jgi:hypothetical protein
VRALHSFGIDGCPNNFKRNPIFVDLTHQPKFFPST